MKDRSIQHPPPKPVKKRGRIVLSLLIVLFAVGMLPLLTVVRQLVESNREALKTSHQQYQLLLARTLNAEFAVHLESGRRALAQLGESLSRSRGFPGPGQFEREADVAADGSVLIFAYRDNQGRTRIYAPNRVATGFEEAMQVLAEQSRDVLENKLLEGLESRPHRADPNDSSVLIARTVPVLVGGKIVGSVSSLVDLRPIWSGLISQYRTGHSFFALDDHGNTFLSSDPQWLVPGNAMERSELVGRFLASEGRSQETTPFIVDAAPGNSVGYLGSFSMTPEGWGIFVIAPEEQVYLPVQQMIRSTWSVGSAAIAGAIVIAILFAGTLSRPIDRLAAASRAFAAGDFSSRVEVRANNEIGELADTFNLMAEEIQHYIRDLEVAARENHELFLGTIRALAQAIDAKDPYTRGHSLRVNKYSVIISRYLRLSKKDIRDVHISSLLHDVGKIGIDDVVLKKPGRLTDEEFEIIKLHPVLGANIMAPIRQMKRILPGLRWHHERMNGSGYPDGLKGERIPLMARIIAVADTFDAMTTNRPYQTPMPFQKSLERINELSGTHFDPRIVKAFNEAFAAGEFAGEDSGQQNIEVEKAG
jgi:HD-GYP domain-containing protein (c-di-GMP phosphodiesterase class II)